MSKKACYNSANFKKQKHSSCPKSLANKIRHRGQLFPFTYTNESIATSAFIDDELSDDSDDVDCYWDNNQLVMHKLVGWMKVLYLLSMFSWGIIFWFTPIVIFLMVLTMFGEGGFSDVIYYFSQYLILLLPALAIYYIPEKIMKKDKVLSFVCKDYCLSREFGTVTFYGSRNDIIFEYPFIEFDCILQSSPNHQGLLHYNLMLVHRYSDEKYVIDIGSMVGKNALVAEYHRFWNMIQRYMDVSQPLPDILLLEPFRNLDPITKEHDEKTGRDPKYWRSMNKDEYKSTMKKIAKEQEDKNIPASGQIMNIFEDEGQLHA